LDHDDLAVEPGQPRQRLDQGRRLSQRTSLRPARVSRRASASQKLGRLCQIGDHVEYAEFSCTYAAVKSVVSTVASADPAARSTVTVTSRGPRSTLARSSAAAPFLHTHTPLIATLS